MNPVWTDLEQVAKADSMMNKPNLLLNPILTDLIKDTPRSHSFTYKPNILSNNFWIDLEKQTSPRINQIFV